MPLAGYCSWESEIGIRECVLMFADWFAGATITLGERSQRGELGGDKRLGVEEGEKRTELFLCI